MPCVRALCRSWLGNLGTVLDEQLASSFSHGRGPRRLLPTFENAGDMQSVSTCAPVKKVRELRFAGALLSRTCFSHSSSSIRHDDSTEYYFRRRRFSVAHWPEREQVKPRWAVRRDADGDLYVVDALTSHSPSLRRLPPLEETFG